MRGKMCHGKVYQMILSIPNDRNTVSTSGGQKAESLPMNIQSSGCCPGWSQHLQQGPSLCVFSSQPAWPSVASCCRYIVPPFLQEDSRRLFFHLPPGSTPKGSWRTNTSSQGICVHLLVSPGHWSAHLFIEWEEQEGKTVPKGTPYMNHQCGNRGHYETRLSSHQWCLSSTLLERRNKKPTSSYESGITMIPDLVQGISR